MPLMTEEEEVNSKLAQFKLALENHLVDSKNNIEWIFERICNLNQKAQMTKYLKSCHPEWIGCTTLHLAAHLRDVKAFKILISKGVDFTIKNSDEATALHIAIEKSSNTKIIIDAFVELVMSAHLEYKNFQNPSNKNGLSHFHVACLANKVELVEQYLNHEVSIDHAVNMDSTLFPGYTPLHFAVEYICVDVTRVLLSHGANTQSKNAKGMTPLQMLLKKNLELADPFVSENYESKVLNEEKKSKNKTKGLEKSDTANLGAEEINKIATMIKMFHVDGCNANIIVDESGLSQLHALCTLKDLKEIELLLAKVEDVNQSINIDSPFCPGYTALHFAAHFDIDTVKILLKKGANIEAKDAQGLTPFDTCLRRYDPLDIHSIIQLIPSWKNIVLSDTKTRLTDLIFAMRDADSYRKFSRKLGKKNLDIYVPNDSPLWPGFSLLHVALVLGKKELQEIDKSRLQILEDFINRAPTLLKHQDAHGWTPLHLVFRLQKDFFVDVLIAYQKLTNACDIVDEDGLSFTHIAALTNSNDFLEKLLSNGSNVNAVYEGESTTWPWMCSGSTPLHFSVAYNSEDAIKTLYKHNANVYAKDDNYMTPIHLIATTIRGKFARGSTLLNWPNLKDSVVKGVGLSHLHVACMTKNLKPMKCLIQNRANIHQKLTSKKIMKKELSCLDEWKGCTPLEIALKKNQENCADELIQHDPDCLLKNHSLIYDILKGRYFTFICVSVIRKSKKLQNRLKAKIGLTELHLVFLDFMASGGYDEWLDFKADLNTQIHNDSPIWPGWTPAHVLVSQGWSSRAIEFFEEAGINVTLQNADGDTVLHMTFKKAKNGYENIYVEVLGELLRLQADFAMNPTNIEGISHFHVACAIGDAPIVEKFLQQGSIDVNRPIDFHHEELGGQTPLHLLASARYALNNLNSFNQYNEPKILSMQLRTAELLLEYGADVHAKNSSGNTALHECARAQQKHMKLFERIAKAGADVNAKNILGYTPLDYLLSEREISLEDIHILLRFGCNFNSFNPVTEEGCLGRAFCSLSTWQMEDLVCSLKTHYSSLFKADDENRTIIHNLASMMDTSVMIDKYTTLIGKLSSIGYDVDEQDIKGRTPLHMAVKFEKVQGISALLKSGASVDIVDACGFTAFDYCLYGCDHCRQTFYSDIVGYEDAENENKSDADSREYDDDNESDADSREYDDDNESDDVDDGSESDISFREDFKELSLIKCQHVEMYKAMVNHVNLLEIAKQSLIILLGFRLPDVCSIIILKLLKKSELRKLIASTNNEEILKL